ncbi:hypothetical protein CJ195_06690 [Bacillus sp. UMB0899]|uniref:DUF5658 family protein n=1 Tax=Metabacillus schmidteae TaxID=2730405 RepID=UPI000C800E7A|nr:DUF5658 family protein [Metabacillus schmidteae]PMC39599.1 hypothetical protein CJ195_06690 [Bacillus sp. UMB0899]
MRFLCYYIALLNIVDALATYIGVSGRHIQEANPLMNVLLDLGPMPFLFTKILLSFILFSLLYFDKIPNWNILKRILGVGSILYTIIIGFHGFWIVEVFYS